LLAVALAAAALAVGVAPAGAADDLVRLGGGTATLALDTNVQADTVAVGRWCGGFRSFCGPRFCGSFYGGFCRSYCAPRFYSCYRPFGYCGYSSFGFGLGCYRPYCSYLYAAPLYYSYAAYYPISTTVIAPPISTTVVTPPTILNGREALPLPSISGYPPATPATPPMPPAQPGTFSYDGGPSVPVPLPRRDVAPLPLPAPAPTPAPMSVPPNVQGKDRIISLPGATPKKYSYPAYGEGQKQPALNYGRDLQVNYPR
jgi:hypothetical protein